MNAVPGYRIRGLEVQGFQNQAGLVDHLFAGKNTKTGLLVAVNAEQVIATEQDAELRDMVGSAAYAYADGISIVRSIRRKYSVRLDRISGVDLWQAVMRRAGSDRVPVFLVGGKLEVLRTVERKLRAEWNVEIVGCQHGYFSQQDRGALQQRIRRSGAAIVAVALNSPAQERFMHECHQLYPDALYMGVSGTFDVFSGAVSRAPVLLRRLGLEWLHRVVTQPAGLGRLRRVLRYASYHYTSRL